MNRWQRYFHEHKWSLYGYDRLVIHKKTFMVSIYLCDGCDEVKSAASDMKWYLEMKSVHIGRDETGRSFTRTTHPDGREETVYHEDI